MASTEPDQDLHSLDWYHVSTEVGFILPEPLEDLPVYFQPWMDIARRIPELVDAHLLRFHVDKMPLLNSQFLKGYRELRLAHLALGMLTMGYVWQEGENDTVESFMFGQHFYLGFLKHVAQVNELFFKVKHYMEMTPSRSVMQILPRALAVPFWDVSQRLGLPPILTHADAVLANWRKRDPEGPFDISNLETLFSLPGGASVHGFFMATFLVELSAVPGLKSIPAVINGVRGGDSEEVAAALEEVSRALQSMTDTLKLLHVYVDPAVFYGIMRIFLSGWKDNPSMSKGLVYEGVQEEPMEFSGGSAAESSLLHCFDELLGVKHDVNGGGEFLMRMRDYMPPAHKQLVQDISVQPSLQRFVQEQGSERLTQTFQHCLTKLLDFRSYHINIVSRFITVPAARARQLRDKKSRDDEGEMLTKAPTALEERGTGGSGIMVFLKTVRDETRKSFLSDNSEEKHQS